MSKPDNFACRPAGGHSTSIRVRYADTDQSGAVYHANYVKWFEAARVEAMRAAGIPYTEIEAAGIHLPVIDLHVRYHLPAFYDDLLEVWSSITELSRTRVKFEYILHRVGESKPLATGHTVHPFVDVAGRVHRVDRMPEFWQRIRAAVERLQGDGRPTP